MGTFDNIIFQLALLTSLTFGWSLLLKNSRTADQPAQHQMLELGMATLIALVLMRYPIELQEGFLLDLRMVPIALLGLRYGPAQALLAAVPSALYRMYLGGVGMLPAMVSLGGLLLVLTVAWAWSVRSHQSIQSIKWLPWVLFLPVVAGILMLPEGPTLLWKVFPVFYLGCSLTLCLAMMVLDSRQMQLRANEVVAQDSLTDPLTGLLNRRGLEHDTVQFYGGNHVLTLDVDRFKSINDRFGHQVGDDVLGTLGTVLRESLGLQHRAYRMGGEEFVVVLRNKTDRQAYRWAEDIRAAFTERVEMMHKHLPEPVTVSAGLVRMAAGEGFHVALSRADELLYQAKSQGRNRTCQSETRKEAATARLVLPSEDENLLRHDLN
ncbi:GGDEF domain-containing protein [Deinococcus cellulosilyticus]|uniref:GGDEF domain-containing protein n=1 Tax=Deinococcus cellulosilyticus (strain DSM 18568 / NBRC 106333 / KACC 11606 / 5516J-15) TaxID=1223518 RepID=A0A511N065_DEIC1|nr:diguanylate cyclase [Deinococcus cellulosilyticus]GEM46224.1 hypothetical protein DC3_18590 [Deinococcus cellulosilyticus NBRC 106333 = KACC 11606]